MFQKGNAEEEMDSPPVSRHRLMYKYKTPPWKETYRQRCQEHLRNSRQRLFNQFRNISTESDDTQKKNMEQVVKQVMEEEWKTLCGNPEALPSLHTGQLENSDDEFDEVVSFIETVQKELTEEETKIHVEYQRKLEIEESSIQASVCHFLKNNVICPVCQKNYLTQLYSTILCPCGLKIDTEQDALNLDHLKHQLEEGVAIHSSSCINKPKFFVYNCYGISNLIMSCDQCDFMFLVI